MGKVDDEEDTQDATHDSELENWRETQKENRIFSKRNQRHQKMKVTQMRITKKW